jgi:hypothetical protein
LDAVRLRRWFWVHSLTIGLCAFAALCWSIGPFFENARVYDFIMNLGHDAAGTAFLFILSAWLYERNKPDEPPA